MSEIKDIFTEVYKKNLWGSEETRSGHGSEIATTKKLIYLLPIIFSKYNITGLIDIGCGDFNWMSWVVYKLKQYMGVDVVEEMILDNFKKYGEPNYVQFDCEVFPYWMGYCYNTDYQAILFADVFVHLPYSEIQKYISVIKESNIKYIFATTFTELPENHDIELSPEAWRPLNMEAEPFCFKKPLELLPYVEPYEQNGKIVNDKHLGLWTKEDI